MHLFAQARVSDDEAAFVEDEVTWEGFDKAGDGCALRLRQRFEFGNGFVEAVGDLNFSTTKPTGKLVVMIAADGEGVALDGHVQDDGEDVENRWATVYQIANEDGLAAFRVDPGLRTPGLGLDRDRLPAQLCQQEAKCCGTAVYVANDVVGARSEIHQALIMA